MQVFLTTLSVVLMIQVSMAGPLVRVKRDINTDFIEALYEYSIESISKSVEMTEHALAKMPKTDAYATYRQDLEGYLKDVDKSNSKPGNCYQKSSDLDQKFNDLIKRYEKYDAPKEAQEVIKLLSEIVKEDWVEKQKAMFTSFMHAIVTGDAEESNVADDERLKQKLLTVC